MTKDYLTVEYNESERPLTDYPEKLAKYLFEKHAMQSGQRLLEIASGRSELASAFSSLGLNVLATDGSPEAEIYAKNHGIDFKSLIIESNKPMEFESNEFDIVFCKSFIEHLHEPLSFFTEVHRILRPGGMAIFLTPDWEANYKIFFDDVTHVQPFTQVSLKQILDLSGYKSISTYRFRQLPQTWKWPFLNLVCRTVTPFTSSRSKHKFLRWSRELMLSGVGYK